MAIIALSELHTTGSELFQDSESFLNDLNNTDSISVYGGTSDVSDTADGVTPILEYGIKGQEFGLLAFGANLTAHILKSFSEGGTFY
ncbi:hypothetical protein [Calothrix sp. PCC 7507]|uniref:hypothetical protein n=1 Tax=Calothrix sp. PCC 7507 TaxID=99598 RepID=UPI00029F2466|nr:hypothetical protein [Calothrix sp. PCC 7507]AFY32117.1 hypothetical protein Cal7507_1659 [Calothrix sp. PCC 7507]